MSADSAHLDTFARDNLPPPEQWPQFVFALPGLQFPARLNAGRLLDRAVDARHGGKAAVLWGEETWSYDRLLDAANRIARVLIADFGLVPGARVLLHASNQPMTIAAWFGVLKAGGIVVSTMPLLRPSELAVVIEKAEISHAVCEAGLKGAVDAAAGRVMRHIVGFGDGELEGLMAAKPPGFEDVDTAADDVAMIAFTSGTTGKPKGCMHFHRDILAMAETFSRQVLKPDPDEVFCGTPPFAFTFGLGGSVVFPVHAFATTALPHAPGYEALCETIARRRVTTLFTAPTAYRAMLKLAADYDLSSLRKCVSAGEPLPAATSDAWREATGIRIIDGIGSTEMIHIFISADGDQIRPGSTGKAVPGYEARVIDDDNRPLPPGSTGRLAVRGPTGCRYLADARQRNYVVDGWNVTGDVYRLDEDGYFWFVSRADDMIISSGYNIGAPEVEQAVLAHPAVLECAVIGAPDEARGQVVTAFVVLHDPSRAGDELRAEIQGHVKRLIAPYKYPRRLEFVSELPKTQTGKLQRFRLRDPAPA
jgi:2-aminobenzoate-CoA ligase